MHHILKPLLIVCIAIFCSTFIAVHASAAKTKTYSNCTALNKDYPHGVGKSGAQDKTSGKRVTTFMVNNAVYKANTNKDRDKDGIACEKR